MKKGKVASSSKRSYLQASKAAKSNKARKNQTKKVQTPVHKNNAKSLGQKHPQFFPNLSSILRNSESQEHEDEQSDYYDNPMHSTAVFPDDLEVNYEKENEQLAPSSKHEEPMQPSAHKGGNVRTEKCFGAFTRISEGVEANESEMEAEDNSNEASSESILEPVKKRKRVMVKNIKHLQARKVSKLSKNVPLQTNAVKIPSDGNSGIKQRTLSASATETSLTSISMPKKRRNKQLGASADSNRDSFHAEHFMETSQRNEDKTSGWKKKKSLVRTSFRPHSSPNSSSLGSASPEVGPLPLKIWCREGFKRSSNDVTDLDVVLNDFEQIVTEYKQSTELDSSRKVVNRFFINLKEQITETIHQIQDLKNLERKNAKVTATFNETRKHLLIAQKELHEQEVELKRLQKEYSELSEKKADLQDVAHFLSGFKRLKKQYYEHRNKNPSEKETYDMASFPALLVEARGVLGAEKQLHIINTKLQQALDKK
ncbi:centromere protein U isoform X2 [Narcine bancroftii]|uniref:centromere protein U isoform X2 n=1 Tax=Narcine bancroftii TaxID=1343680 RepID=UPI003831A50C